MTNLKKQVLSELKQLIEPGRAENSLRFFKTAPGEYGEGDQFLGVRVPDQRKVAKAFFKDATLEELALLLKSDWHEVRLTTVFMLVYKYEKSKLETEQEKLVNFYLQNLDGVNNWDLVDSSASYILGDFLVGKDDISILYKLSQSHNLWAQRVAIIATHAFIKNGRLKPTLELAKMLLSHEHDLMQKAIGWMLRELGKKSPEQLLDFIKENFDKMPRTMLRYAIEKFPENKRKLLLKGTFDF